jgi:hypothetical protein
MSYEEFKATLSQNTPPENLNDLLKAIWFDGKGNWTASHDVAQEIHTKEGSWIHAYLHRKEGDLGNATYWYSKAGKPVAKVSLDEEWEQLVREFLKSKV